MSHIGDLIIAHGPLKPGDPDPLHSLTLGDFNALCDELIELRSDAAASIPDDGERMTTPRSPGGEA